MTIPEILQQSLAESRGRKAFRLERDGELATLWFDYPDEKVNKFSSWVVVELDKVLDQIAAMTDVKKVLIASAKPGIFIAGADITEFTKITASAQAEEFVRFGQSVFTKLRKLPQITFAVINGACVGGGCELALNCDYRLMSDSPKAVIGLPEVKLGILPAWSGTTRLPRLVGIQTALDLILNGKTLNAKRAQRAGLIDEILPEPILLEAARKFASRITSKKRPANQSTHFYIEGNPLARKVIFNKFRKGTQEKSGGHYPALQRVIDVMETSYSKGQEAGLNAEAREIGRLITDPVSQNLVQLFFITENAKKDRAPAPRPIMAAGVLGAGLMGAGIAQNIADKADIGVRIKDVNWIALGSGLKAISRVWKKKVDLSRMSRREMATKVAKVSPTTDWSGFTNVDVLIEAVVEILAVKQQVLAEFEAIAKPGAIFATNTSTIPITRIAEKARAPENVIGMHFFSPVDRMPLLEVIAGAKTSPATISTIVAFGKKLGKTVVVCKDGPGFIVNRILGPYINEAGFLLEEGYSVDAIDKAMIDFGMPMGPLALLDEVGIDIAQKAGQILAEAFSDRIHQSNAIEALIKDNRLGKKNGRGIYQWKEGKRQQADAGVHKLLGSPTRKEAKPEELVERMVLAMVNEGSLVLSERIADSAADVDLSMIMGTGFPPFRGGPMRYADSHGLPYVVGRLEDLEARVGKRFAASEPLRRLAVEESSFYKGYPAKA
ncbi:MAG TPA: 3-hydroxyacyl-CoA dehydrogenase NAD-binding domain-containing protein [Thermoanaerobaculia bacterium]|nr:3-hydroxyacyl-CoA dehydrogenase NAD-binding domain-containing protein [Thermoanaerobaculia bacterium]